MTTPWMLFALALVGIALAVLAWLASTSRRARREAEAELAPAEPSIEQLHAARVGEAAAAAVDALANARLCTDDPERAEWWTEQARTEIWCRCAPGDVVELLFAALAAAVDDRARVLVNQFRTLPTPNDVPVTPDPRTEPR